MTPIIRHFFAGMAQALSLSKDRKSACPFSRPVIALTQDWDRIIEDRNQAFKQMKDHYER